MDKGISSEFMKILTKQGLNFHLKTKVNSIKKTNSGVNTSTTNDKGKNINFESDVVLISVGRKPYTKNLNLDKVGVEVDKKGIISSTRIRKFLQNQR